AWSFLPLTKAMVYQNGKLWKEFPLSGDRMTAAFREKLSVTQSGWYALAVEGAAANRPVENSFPQAGTNAVRVYVGDQKIRNRASADYFARWIDKLRSMAERWPGWGSQEEKDRVFGQFSEVRRIYERLAAEAPGQ
ncbi:MAG: hypothetical protein ACRD88_10720, partial [Terriglobia bacterium]